MPEWTDCLFIHDGQTRIEKKKSIICQLENGLPSPDDDLSELLSEMETKIKNVADIRGMKRPTTQAFSNSRGEWFERLVALGFWQARCSGKGKYRDIAFGLLTNRNSLDMVNLFMAEEKSFLLDLRHKLANSGIGMVTSNPDMIGCITDDQEIRTLMEKPITCVSEDNYLLLTDFYKNLLGKCNRNNLMFGIAIKTSTRADRQFQVPSEGSLWKAIISHLHKRYWESSMRFKYHAVLLEEPKPKVIEAFHTVATHSITDPNVVPVRATDKAFNVTTFGDIVIAAEEIFDEALSS